MKVQLSQENYRIDFKAFMLVWNCLKGHAPKYLQGLLNYKNVKKNLRNQSRSLIVPNVQNSTFAYRSFSVYAPRLWNSLPVEFRNSR